LIVSVSLGESFSPDLYMSDSVVFDGLSR
jgi:hypothetical protein